MSRALEALSFVEKELSRGFLAAVERLLGPTAATLAFAFAPLRRTPARLDFLIATIARRRGADAAAAAGLRLLRARPHAPWYAAILGHMTAAPSRETLERALPGLIAAARRGGDPGFLAVALYDRGEADLARACFEAARPAGPAAAAFVAACLHRPDAAEPAGLATPSVASLAPGPARRRLLVVEPTTPRRAVAALAAGAERTTVLTFGDLYGALDPEIGRWLPEGAGLDVEHARSRADRFSPRYHALHVATADAARALTASLTDLVERFKPRDVETAALAPALTLEFADLFFFAALRIDAVLAAMRDPAFDDVVVCFERDWRLYRGVFADPALAADPRLRLCCRAQTAKVRGGHFARLAQARELMLGEAASPRHRDEPASVREAALEKAVEEYLDAAARTVRRAGGSYSGREDPVALAGDQNRAYLSTTADIATALRRRFDIDVLWTQGRPSRLADALDAAAPADDPRPGTVLIVPDPPTKRAMASLTALIHAHAPFAALAPVTADDAAVRVAVRNELDGAVPRTLLVALGRLRRAATTLERYRYRALAICPARSPANLQLVAVARAAGVPSIAVEPHCLNSAYCRYAAVPADLAAVCLDHFADDYGRHFGIPRDRCVAIGSPRIHPPEGYDGAAARRRARAEIGLGPKDPPLILTPTQPMADVHAMAVWRMAAAAAAGLDRPAILALKPHPEERPDRVRRYLTAAAEAGAADRCRLVEGDIKTLIAAADLVLVLYSVTALEAAALDRPVAVLGQPGVDYPIAYHEILGAPFCADVAATAAAMRAALDRDPAVAARRAAFRAANPNLFDAGYYDRLADAIDALAAQGPAAIRPAATLPRDPFVTAPFRPYFVEENP